LHAAADDWIEHPFRDLQMSRFRVFVDPAPRHNPAILGERLMNCHNTAAPRMPGITDFSRFDIMGVALLSCTMRIGRIWGWRRIRQQGGRFLALHQAEVRFDRFLDLVACIIATQWQRRRAALLYGQLHL
jgi:hypothetical protein